MSSRLYFSRSRKPRNRRSIDGQVQETYRTSLAFRYFFKAAQWLSFTFLSSFSSGLLYSAELTLNEHAVASAHPYATEAGLDVLNAGGNAFDAAIAVASVLAVVEPYSSGFGGGGFWLLHKADGQSYHFIDGRETAPQKAHSDMYLDDQGKLNRSLSINGAAAAGIPGQAAALNHLAGHYGKLPLAKSLSAAIRYADEGFPVDSVYQTLAGYRLKAMQENAATRRIFLTDDGEIPEVDTLIIQKELAGTLRRFATQGHIGFYQGQTAQALVNNMKSSGGIWTLDDLANYQVVERKPVRFEYQGYRFWSAPPPSAGGIALAQMFGMLKHQALPDHRSIEETQLLVEVMRRAYRDRAEYLGDPDFIDIPNHLMANDYLSSLSASIKPSQATDNAELKSVLPPTQGTDTTHYSVMDRWGNRVSATLSINLPFGSAYTDPDTGLLLNNEMDDFSSQPGVPNAYGLVATEANAIAAGKRPLSSMTPTMVESDNEVAILGTPGGSRIITMVFLGALEHINKLPVDAWVARPRFHHQYLPDVIQHEPGTFSTKEAEQLRKFGYQLKSVGRNYGNMQAIHWNKRTNTISAAADPRRIGEARVEKLEQVKD